jgi:uncharacterized membrane protein YphA (DoxX/SURF4 family)
MKQKILFVICLLFGLFMINAGLNKFLNYMPMPKDMPESLVKAMTAFMTITWLMPLVGFVEILGGILVMIPKTRALGAIVLFPVVIGILLTNTITEPSGLAMGLVVLAIDLWLIIENREKYLPMVR